MVAADGEGTISGGARQVVDDVLLARNRVHGHVGASGGHRHATVRPRIDDGDGAACVGDVDDFARVHLRHFFGKDNTVDTDYGKLEIGLADVVMDNGDAIDKVHAVHIINVLTMYGNAPAIENDSFLGGNGSDGQNCGKK